MRIHDLPWRILLVKTTSLALKTEAEVWLRILHPDEEMSPHAARAILGLSFPKTDVTRMHELSAKARTATLTREEDAEMDNYERVGSILSILKSKARQVLKRSNRSS
jgi:hypothetical protein